MTRGGAVAREEYLTFVWMLGLLCSLIGQRGTEARTHFHPALESTPVRAKRGLESRQIRSDELMIDRKWKMDSKYGTCRDTMTPLEVSSNHNHQIIASLRCR